MLDRRSFSEARQLVLHRFPFAEGWERADVAILPDRRVQDL